MIGHLKGVVLQQDLKSIILDVAGVGYKIYTNTAILDGKKEKILEFWTYLAVRENALDLYGFATKEELHFFELPAQVAEHLNVPAPAERAGVEREQAHGYPNVSPEPVWLMA